MDANICDGNDSGSLVTSDDNIIVNVSVIRKTLFVYKPSDVKKR
jgi:hypothetical protein